MSNPIPQKCPACEKDMRICLMKCSGCPTEIQGEFVLNRLARLAGDQLHFLETFLRYRGNLKDAGTHYGISYPTARNRLNNLIEALGFEEIEALPTRRLTILDQLKEGRLTTEEALEQLQGGHAK